jgi:NAD(P)-dependent dehydrogenase (short-subunit alcohol dehydrogenase family)
MNTIFKSNLFNNKVALITGGGTGIGLRTARELASLGATVILASRKIDNLMKAADLIKNEGGKAIPIACDIRDETSIQKCVEQAINEAGTIDYLVNNGGGQFPSLAESISRKGWNAVIETNLTGTFFMSQEIFNKVFIHKGGAIVSVLADMRNGFPMLSHTGAARAGVENLTKSLANEWGRYGVRINAITPGTIHSTGLDNYPPQFRQRIFNDVIKNNQAYRLGTEAEIAASILFLLSPGASYITGITLAVDAGESIYSPLAPPVQNNKYPVFKDEDSI